MANEGKRLGGLILHPRFKWCFVCLRERASVYVYVYVFDMYV